MVDSGTSDACRGSSPAASIARRAGSAIVFNPRLCCSRAVRCARRKLRETCSSSPAPARKLGLTTIFITHDQEEALVCRPHRRDEQGSIQQVATTTEIYERPANDSSPTSWAKAHLPRHGERAARSR